MPEPTQATCLWQDYAFLTREILKFIQKKDFDMVLELLAQRDKLQELLDNLPDKSFTASPTGRELLQKIQTQNLTIENILKQVYNNAKHTQRVSDSYDQLGQILAGSFMDRKS